VRLAPAPSTTPTTTPATWPAGGRSNACRRPGSDY